MWLFSYGTKKKALLQKLSIDSIETMLLDIKKYLHECKYESTNGAGEENAIRQFNNIL